MEKLIITTVASFIYYLIVFLFYQYFGPIPTFIYLLASINCKLVKRD